MGNSITETISRYIDNLYMVISPKKAVDRIRQRQYYYGYEAANPSRRFAFLPSDDRAENINKATRRRIRARARDLERNSPIMGALLKANENGTVGAGFNIQSLSGDEQYDSLIEDLWREWEHHENCDYVQRQSLDDILKMLLLRLTIDGGVLVTFKMDKERYIPLTLQVHEIDDLDTTDIPQAENGNVIQSGVEIDMGGRVVAYWLKRTAPDGITEEKPIRVDAKDAIFLWNKSRPSQYREISPCANIIDLTKEVGDYNSAVSFYQKLLASAMGVIESDNVMNGGPGRITTANTSTPKVEVLEGGTVKQLAPGERMKLLVPNGQAAEVDKYLSATMRMVSAPLGLSLESTARNVEKVNYSSARQNLIADSVTFKVNREFLNEYFLRPVFKRFVKVCFLKGYLDGTAFKLSDRRFYAAKWLGSTTGWIDPLKEAKANSLNLANGGKSFQSYCAEQGVDWKDRVMEMKEAKEFAETQGINLAFLNADLNTNNIQRKGETEDNGEDEEDL